MSLFARRGGGVSVDTVKNLLPLVLVKGMQGMQRIKELLLRAKITLVRWLQNPYIKHPVAAVVGGLLLIFLAFLSLSLFTRHGSEFRMPELRGMTLQEATALAKEKGLRIVVEDSSYVITRRPSEVLEQVPRPDAHVKRGRRVFLSINAQQPQMVEVPNLEGETIRQALVELERAGLVVGKLLFAPDFALNSVLKQTYKGAAVQRGTMLPKGSAIDLTLGDGLEISYTSVPALMGYTLAEARNALAMASLNLGRILYDETVKDMTDSLAARVYSVYPKPLRGGRSLTLGARVDLWLTLNESRIANQEIEEQELPEATDSVELDEGREDDDLLL